MEESDLRSVGLFAKAAGFPAQPPAFLPQPPALSPPPHLQKWGMLAQVESAWHQDTVGSSMAHPAAELPAPVKLESQQRPKAPQPPWRQAHSEDHLAVKLQLRTH